MRRGVLLLGLTALAFQLTSATAGAVTFTSFVSPRYHYRIAYPVTWRVHPVSARGIHYDIFLGPTVRSNRGPFLVNVNVAIDSAGVGRTTDTYARAAERANAAQGALTDARFRTTIAGRPAWLLQGHLNRLRRNAFRMIVFVRGRHGWQITLSAPRRSMPRFRPLFESMVSSFRTT